MANKQELQKQINDLNNQINSTTDENEKNSLTQRREELQRELDK